MKIYTKTGDDGETGLLGGDRIAKNSPRIEALGDVDELNAAIGLARTHSAGSELDEILRKTQSWLFDLGAELACPPQGKFQVLSLSEREIEVLEHSIDTQTADLPELKEFILPGGTPLAAHLHLARSVCRRAERHLWDLHAAEPLREEPMRFLNRLSDWLFVSARTANFSAGADEPKWEKVHVSND
ncbi:MAG: cob(I)yrinic acid a,c-diamide adenosyltransferase [Fimbriimonas sp.]